MALPTRAFAKALRSFETGGFTADDLLTELDAILTAGANPAELSEVLRLRQEIEPLPTSLYTTVTRTLKAAQARADDAAAAAEAAHAAAAGESVAAAAAAATADTAAANSVAVVTAAAAAAESKAVVEPAPLATPVAEPLVPIPALPLIEVPSERRTVEKAVLPVMPAERVSPDPVIVPPTPVPPKLALPSAEVRSVQPMFAPAKISRRASVDETFVPDYLKESSAQLVTATPKQPVVDTASQPLVTPTLPPKPLEAPPPIPPPLAQPAPPRTVPRSPVTPRAEAPVQLLAPPPAEFELTPLYDPTIPEPQLPSLKAIPAQPMEEVAAELPLFIDSSDLQDTADLPSEAPVEKPPSGPSPLVVGVRKVFDSCSLALSAATDSTADALRLGSEATAKSSGAALKGLSESIRSGGLRLADGTGMLLTSAADAVGIARTRAAERAQRRKDHAAAAASAAAERAASNAAAAEESARAHAAAQRMAEAEAHLAKAEATAAAVTVDTRLPDEIADDVGRFAPPNVEEAPTDPAYPYVPLYTGASAAAVHEAGFAVDLDSDAPSHEADAVPDTVRIKRLKRPAAWSRLIRFGLAAVGLIVVTVYFAQHRQATPPALDVLSDGAKLPVVAAGTIIKDCPTCLAMTMLPAAQFKQGSLVTDSSASSFEKPQHWVIIGHPPAMAINLVTVDEFREFADATKRDMQGCDTYDGAWKLRAEGSWKNPGFKQTGTHPVTCISWSDAVAYADWYSAKTGHHYRLPTASEWEYSARAGSDAVQQWGNTAANACMFANVADQSAARRYPGWASFACSDGYINTSPVGAFKANAFGLEDMLGNVFQWTEDCWHPDYRGAPVDGSSRKDGDCKEHELRGGSWFTKPAYVRANYRNHFAADYRASSVGIRLVRDPSP